MMTGMVVLTPVSMGMGAAYATMGSNKDATDTAAKGIRIFIPSVYHKKRLKRMFLRPLSGVIRTPLWCRLSPFMNDFGFKSRAIGNDGPVPRVRAPKTQRSASRLKAMFASVLRRLKKPKTTRGWKRILLQSVLAIAILGMASLGILWVTLPNIDDPATMFPAQSTVILDRNGVELYRLFTEEDRTYVAGDGINPFVKKATIAIEDQRFISRNTCFDLTGYMRAALSQLAPSYFVRSGGSTLTQQFAGNALVGRERSILRKVRELLLACQLEQRYDKNELLELYLNWIPYGQNAYGVEQASKKYFGIGAKDLTLAQASILASLPHQTVSFPPKMGDWSKINFLFF